MALETFDQRIDRHVISIFKIMEVLDRDFGFIGEDACRLAVGIHRNMIFEEALLGNSDIPTPLLRIADSLEEIGQSEIFNYMP